MACVPIKLYLKKAGSELDLVCVQGLLMCDLEQDKDMWDIQNPKTCHVNTYKT